MMKVTVNYTPTGVAYSDFDLENQFTTSIINNHGYINCSTENAVHYARWLHMKKEIELIVLFKGKEIRIDKDGNFEDYPDGFLDRNINIHLAILNIRLDM